MLEFGVYQQEVSEEKKRLAKRRKEEKKVLSDTIESSTCHRVTESHS
jgi:hypothetical protein